MASDFDPDIRALIARQVRRLVRRGYSPQDRPDLEQHLSAVVHQRAASFDCQRGDLRAFVATVVARAAHNLLRHRFAARRDERGKRRTDVTVLPDHRTAQEQERTDLAADVADLIAQLPSDLQRLAELLKTDTVASAARRLGVARSTAGYWAAKLRKRFEKRGMRKYL